MSAVATGQVQAEAVSRYRYVIGGLLLLLNLAIGLSFFAISPLLPLIVYEYGISRTEAGLLSGLAIVVQALFSIPGGMLAVRMGLRRAFLVGALMLSVPVLTPLAGNFVMLMALRVVFALGAAMTFPATGSLIVGWFKPRELPVMTALNWAAQSLGMAISMFVAAPVADALGWKGALAALTGVTVAGAIAWAFFGRAKDGKGARGPLVSFRELRASMFARVTLLMAVADGAGYAVFSAFTTWLPTFYNEKLHLSLDRVGAITAFLPLAGAVGVLVGGILPAVSGSKRPFVVVPGILLVGAAIGTFITPNLAVIYVSIMALGFLAWVYGPALFTLPMDLPGASATGIAMTWAMVATMAATLAFISPLTVGALADLTHSYVPGLTLWAVLSLAMAVAGTLLPWSRPAKAPREEKMSEAGP